MGGNVSRIGLVGLLAVLGASGCRHEPAPRGATHEGPRAPATAAATITSSDAPPPAPEPELPARVEHIAVPNDLTASIVRAGKDKAPLTLFFPGICSNANAYLQTFPEAAKKQGGVIAIEGDQPCGASGDYHTFTWDAARLHARVEKALAAAGVTELPKEGLTIVGYSQGASLAEQMAARWPDRYSRVVLIGSPTNPAPGNFVKTRGVVTMSCDRDVPARMKQAAAGLRRVGTPATYFEMPHCVHGNITDGERIFSDTFDWLRTNEKPLAPPRG